MKSWITFAIVVFLTSDEGIGQITILDAVDRGWYNEDEIHEVDNTNYFVGDGRGPIGSQFDYPEFRNFFVFDLSGIQDEIFSASLSLFIPFPTGFFSNESSETYQIVEVSSSIFELVTGAAFAYEDLATGTVYGTVDVVNNDVGTMLKVPLNAAALSAMNARSGEIAFGGSITTLNEFADDEFLFGFTSKGEPLTQLIVDTSLPVDGDFNDDSIYDCADVDALVAEIAAGGNNLALDLTGDAEINQDDLTTWLAESGAANLASANPYLIGDASLDGVVDISDFNLWNGSKFTNTAAWCSGDFNADGVVDVADFNLWNGNKFSASDDITIVPEPGLQVLIWPTLFAMLIARSPKTLRPNHPTRHGNAPQTPGRARVRET